MDFFGHKKNRRWIGICLECFGEKCEKCSGKGYTYYTQQPVSNGRCLTLFKAFIWFKNYNLFPSPGTWIEQTAIFLKTIEFCELMNTRLIKMKEEHNKQIEESFSRKKSQWGKRG